MTDDKNKQTDGVSQNNQLSEKDIEKLIKVALEKESLSFINKKIFLKEAKDEILQETRAEKEQIKERLEADIKREINEKFAGHDYFQSFETSNNRVKEIEEKWKDYKIYALVILFVSVFLLFILACIVSYDMPSAVHLDKKTTDITNTFRLLNLIFIVFVAGGIFQLFSTYSLRKKSNEKIAELELKIAQITTQADGKMTKIDSVLARTEDRIDNNKRHTDKELSKAITYISDMLSKTQNKVFETMHIAQQDVKQEIKGIIEVRDRMKTEVAEVEYLFVLARDNGEKIKSFVREFDDSKASLDKLEAHKDEIEALDKVAKVYRAFHNYHNATKLYEETTYKLQETILDKIIQEFTSPLSYNNLTPISIKPFLEQINEKNRTVIETLKDIKSNKENLKGNYEDFKLEVDGSIKKYEYKCEHQLKKNIDKIKKELVVLAAQKKEFIREIENIKDTVGKDKEKSDLKGKLQSNNDTINQKNEENNKLDAELKRLKNIIKIDKNRQTNLETEINNIDSEITKIDKRIKQIDIQSPNNGISEYKAIVKISNGEYNEAEKIINIKLNNPKTLNLQKWYLLLGINYFFRAVNTENNIKDSIEVFEYISKKNYKKDIVTKQFILINKITSYFNLSTKLEKLAILWLYQIKNFEMQEQRLQKNYKNQSRNNSNISNEDSKN